MVHSQLKKATFAQILRVLIGKLKVFSVNGDSMQPILENGDWIIIDPHFQKDEIQKGMICIANHPFITGKKVVKYIDDVDQDGQVFLLGANPRASTDSRSFGWIKKEQIFAIVQSKIFF
jgi:nickel-type superoxide dismutase maturation protease